LIVGDAMQLPHIVELSARRDRELLDRHRIDAAWIDEHQMSVRRHSAFHTAEHAAGTSMLLDEHFRCHPTIAELSNRLFYGGTLNVLTDQGGRGMPDRSAVEWRDVRGEARRRGGNGSWFNTIEAVEIVTCVEQLLAQLPAGTSIGVVTPYRAQADKVVQLLAGRGGERVRVGTVHTFQGGECDVMVFSLVAAGNVPGSMFNWFDGQARLWNVAITRARSSLIVVGDRELWRQRGGIGGELLATAEGREPSPVEDEQLRIQLYRLLHREDPGVELARVVHGYRTDAVLGDGTVVLLDHGVPDGGDPAVHMERMLRRRTLLAGADGQPARRLPLWRLFDQEA